MPRADRTLPLWLHMTDAVAIALGAADLLVLLTGGGRFYLGDVRVSVTSPGRMLLAAGLLVVARHLTYPHPSLRARVRVGLGWARARLTPAAGAAWTSIVAIRLPVLLVGFMAVTMVGYGRTPPFRASSHEFWNLPARWDAGWYLGIATHGYQWSPNRRGHQNIAFFPAYPLLMRAGATVLGAHATPEPGDVERRTAVAGLVLSLVAFWWAVAYLYRLARQTLDAERSRAAVLLTAAYPFAVFFGALYSEALFLLASVAAFYHFPRREWRAAGAWGLLAGLTRPNGCLLSVPLGLLAVMEGIRSYRAQPGDGSTARQAGWWRASLRGLGAAAMPGVGMLVFSAYIMSLTGHPFTWIEAHEAWGRSYRGPGELVAGWYRDVFSRGLYHYAANDPFGLLNLMATLFALALVWPVVRRFGVAYGVFLVVSLLPPLLAGGLVSMGRITAVLFPLFLYLASALPAGPRAVWIGGSVIVQGFAAVLFYTWRRLF